MTTPSTSPSQSLQAQRIPAMSVIAMVPILGVVSALVFDLHEYPSPLVAGGLFVLNLPGLRPGRDHRLQGPGHHAGHRARGCAAPVGDGHAAVDDPPASPSPRRRRSSPSPAPP
uniref:Uncharacterized protein n=1 Tax=Janibacter limosus TaxID=53458 RepID=A0AC61U1K4_9MICO|nr:hypothetical protein [Janibacter limosus]